MHPDDIHNLERRLSGQEREFVRLRRGEVTDDSPLTVDMGASGVSVPAVKLSSYTPTVNDQVVILRVGSGVPLILGEVDD